MIPSKVREGLATALQGIANLRVFDYVPDSLAPPAAVIEPVEVTWDQAMQRGLDYYKAYVLVIVGRVDERTASNRLDAYLNGSGASSVKTALEQDRTLGGACSSLEVTDALPRSVVVSGVEMLAYRFGMDIYG